MLDPQQARLSRDRIDALADEIALTACRLDAAQQVLLANIRAFDQAGGWAWQGAKSCAAWLSWRIGCGRNAANEKVRVATALGALPLIEAALGAGELSYCKVRAMTRVATPENEKLLLDQARSATGAELERICAAVRHVVRPRHGRGDDDVRYVRRRHAGLGMTRIEAQLYADEAERVWQALAAVRRDLESAPSSRVGAPAVRRDLESAPSSRAGAPRGRAEVPSDAPVAARRTTPERTCAEVAAAAPADAWIGAAAAAPADAWIGAAAAPPADAWIGAAAAAPAAPRIEAAPLADERYGDAVRQVEAEPGSTTRAHELAGDRSEGSIDDLIVADDFDVAEGFAPIVIDGYTYGEPPARPPAGPSPASFRGG